MSGPVWDAPRADGEVFLHPPAEAWAEAARSNLVGPSRAVSWGLRPETVRREAGLLEGPLVASAHQPVLFHAGLWSKSLAASALASSLGWQTIHKVTDQDAPGEADGWVPKRTRDGVLPHALRWSREGVPYAFQDRPGEGDLRDALGLAEDCGLEPVKRAAGFFTEPLGLVWTASSDWDDWHLGCLHALDHVSGTQRAYFRASRIWDKPSFRCFLSKWLSDIPAFGGAYNRALDRYRKDRGIQHPLTPVPNLVREDGWWETPFWTAQPGEARHALWVKPDGGNIHLRSGMDGGLWSWHRASGFEALQWAPWTLWPKALPQALYTRLFLTDFFIHGLGGGAYEPVNDLFLQELSLAPAPAYGTASATLWVDPGAESGIRESLGKADRAVFWRRALEKNPEYLVEKSGEWAVELPGELIAACRSAAVEGFLVGGAREKAALLEALKDPAKRSEAGRKLRELNGFLAGKLAPLYGLFDAFLSGAEGRREAAEALAFREYAFFCHPPERFAEMKGRFQAGFRQQQT